MVRAISVLAAVLVLLGVGWYLGHRPVSALQTQVSELQAQYEKRAQDLEGRAALAEAKGRLWQARAELLVAAGHAGQDNFGLAADRASRARDLITHALGTPGLAMDLGPVRDMLDTAIDKLEALESDAGEVLSRADAELGRLLEQAGQA